MEIKVAIIGQYLSQSGIVASFQEDGDNSWVRHLFNPRDHVRPLLSDGTDNKCFSLWYDDIYGWYYGEIRQSPTDARDGYVMTALCTGKSVITNGDDVLKSFNELGSLFFGKDYQTPKDLQEKCADGVKEAISSLKLSVSTSTNSDIKKEGNAYRIYHSKDELSLFFQYPIQSEYSKFDRIFFIPSSSATASNKSGYHEIKTPIQKVYNVTLPNNGNVTTNKQTVFDGDTIEITYHKAYCEDTIVSLPIDGNNNKYLTYQGKSISINDAAKAGVKFQRFIQIKVSSERGTSLVSIIKYSSKACPSIKYDIDHNGYIFPDGCKKYIIHFSADGYEGKDVELKDEDFNTGLKQVSLKSKSQVYRVLLKTEDGVVSGNISVNTDDPLYTYIKNASQKGESLIYKGFSRPHGPVPKRKTSAFKKILYILIVILGIWLLYAGYCLLDADSTPWPFNSGKNDLPVDSISTTVDDSTRTDTIGCAQDIKYMKKEDTWDKKKIKSEKYKRLCDFIIKGQIDEITKVAWFDDLGNTNSYWQNKDGNGIFDILKSIKDEDDLTQKGIAEQDMKDCSVGDKIKLSLLKKKLQDLLKEGSATASSSVLPVDEEQHVPTTSGGNVDNNKPHQISPNKVVKQSSNATPAHTTDPGRPTSH